MPNPLEHLIMLGNPLLYERCKEVEPSETDDMREVADRMESVLLAFREKYQAGRAIAAPQVGVLKRMIYWRVKEPVVMLNPVLSDLSEEMFSLWDDCMSFPNLLVRLK
ncbi:MAG: peptide deformylase, partial [Bacteroidota bacterium]